MATTVHLQRGRTLPSPRADLRDIIFSGWKIASYVTTTMKKYNLFGKKKINSKCTKENKTGIMKVFKTSKYKLISELKEYYTMAF